MLSYADASFNEVRDVIFTPSSHAQNTVEEQEMVGIVDLSHIPFKGR